MNLKDIMLNDKSQSLKKKKKCQMIHLYEISRVVNFTQTERKLGGYQGLRERRNGELLFHV